MTPRWRGPDSNFQYAGAVNLVVALFYAAECLGRVGATSQFSFTRPYRLTYLAPEITQAILDGRQPPALTADKLMVHSRLPLAWHDQRTVLGFA